jgi:RNA polymerase sporulation-specific sigma factor
MITRTPIDEVLTMNENDFIINNDRLVHNVLKCLPTERIKEQTGLEYEDLFQTGLLAMVRAKRAFKPTFGFQFSTFATPRIHGEILRHVSIHRKVHVPRPVHESYYRIARAGMLQESNEVIAEKFGISVKQAGRAKNLRVDITSLQTPISSENGDATLEDWLISDESTSDIAEGSVTVQEFLATLTPKEKTIWDVYSKTNCGTQITIAKHVGLTQVQVSRTLTKIFSKAEAFGDKLRVGS